MYKMSMSRNTTLQFVSTGRCQFGWGGGGGGGDGTGGKRGMNMQQIMGMMDMVPKMINDLQTSLAKNANLHTVRFIVGENATPSPEMISFAITAGLSPSTQGEKEAYLKLLKKVARRTPSVIAKFVKENTHANGTKTLALDENALDEHITKRALLYREVLKAKSNRNSKQDQMKRNYALGMLRASQMHELNMLALAGTGMTNPPTTNSPLLEAFFMDSATWYGSPSVLSRVTGVLGVNSQPVGHPANVWVHDDTMTLGDKYRMTNASMKSGKKNGDPGPILTTAAPTTVVPTPRMDSGLWLTGSRPMK